MVDKSELKLEVKLEDIIILSESIAKLAQEVHALYHEALNNRIDVLIKKSLEK